MKLLSTFIFCLLFGSAGFFDAQATDDCRETVERIAFALKGESGQKLPNWTLLSATDARVYRLVVSGISGYYELELENSSAMKCTLNHLVHRWE